MDEVRRRENRELRAEGDERLVSKEAAMLLWGYAKRGWAERMWKRWYSWAIRSRLEPKRWRA